MFYSQTYLGRKAPLGTVWSAAHLQHRLKKSDYTATDIPKIVYHIMFPEVPMALRISSYLLLGVVRIYSKKVDYILHDYNLKRTWLAKALVSSEVDLQEDARQAPVESVTLPQALNLEDFDLEDDDTLDMEFDNNLRCEEDITLTDQIPTGIDPYVAIIFDEDIIPESSPMDVDQSTLPASEYPGETDVEMAYEVEPNNVRGGSNVGLDTETYSPRNETEEILEFQDPRPINLMEELNPNSPGSVPEIEKRRDAAHSLSPVSHQHNIRVEHTEPLDDTLNEKETTFPNIDEEELSSRGHSMFDLRSGSPSFAHSEEEHANFAHSSPQLALQPTPPRPTQPRPRKRKRFDNKAIVLSNKVMKIRLEDASDLLRKRKKLPLSRVGLWRLNNQSKKDQIFSEPLFTGFSNVLRSVFAKDCVASKPYLAVSVSEETLPEPESVSSEPEMNPASPVPQSPVPDTTNDPDSTLHLSPGRQTEDIQDYAVPQSVRAESVAREAQSPQTFNNDDVEIERLRDGGFPNYMMSTPPRSSPYRTNDFTSQRGNSETGEYRTEPSHATNQNDLSGSRNLGIPAIPEMNDQEFYFPDSSGNTPVRSSASQDPDALPERTRAVAQDLKERFLSSPASEYPSGDLSLSKILAGKTRKLAAQMFYETLVLKSRGLIDVQQDQPYSDVALKLMPSLFSKVQL
ncbi:unnamed protein product [Microthlaspi erraticum]|uniref:Rad21/Rec8-like protein N-terminal domain-containing protein n=1 Tax=Microthlaspi erraticum TaxID=1685480 RepID=A0A6D2J880_9BRAS|nr:unnamed protein product [Microthlaspi erraticum]